jgi:hypothetical protein
MEEVGFDDVREREARTGGGRRDRIATFAEREYALDEEQDQDQEGHCARTSS